MHTPWIERCTVQRVSLRDGLVLDLDDYNELVIATPIRLTLPPIGSSYPEEQVLIDPGNVSVQQRPLLDLAGAVCTGAWCDEGGGLHLGFSRGHRIDVAPPGGRDLLGALRQTPRLHGMPAPRAGAGGAPRPARRRI
ncbi:hypothetical protein E3G66_000925 [Mycobacteroides abscessus]|nr:DUF6188 family protein [Mycobacteroides abscessus]MBE5429364.1 hypothetical protein [Mycobacteroides abscessus]QOF36783.1 hypothetical protein E3G66_000925 [Mycobacteroides abscessus]SIM47464.1 Uncharacterised protein [Mycobacteroides abscessus subsp. bolletii]SLG99013.1 Uncharacterised protein [Mycobacteroides abscessus subsp. massiliense]SLH15195.1 Uncharacterised protein [Mycobacteroides abscessus subsp. massiliense]